MHATQSTDGGSQRSRVLVTGAAGMLGQAVVEEFAQAHEVLALQRSDCDLVDAETTLECIQQHRPVHIVHCAAYTDVDGCERDPDRALRENGHATRNLATAAARVGASLCYISTDYVFDGSKSEPYLEDDPVAPLNVYGRTKRVGEEHVLQLVAKPYVVRTSWLYGPGGKNFVRTMVGLLQSRDEIQVVDDQRGAPTYTRDLARGLYAVVLSGRHGVYHITNAGSCSWYEFARTIGESLGSDCQVQACSSEEFPRPARRPHNSVLEARNYRQNGFSPIRSWRAALQEYLNLLQAKTEA